MEAVAAVQFSSLELPEGVEVTALPGILVVTKWNWDYQEFLVFQKRAQQFVTKNRSLKIFIICSHPHVYTMGRGNERGGLDLVEFEISKTKLPFKLHKIHRGGGVTFHHPGQWIFYPIVAIKESYSLEDHMCWILKSVAQVLKSDFGIEEVVAAKKLMGVWWRRQKLASIGVGVNRFVTEHGLALNLSFDEKAKIGIHTISPCGMKAEIYSSVSEILEESDAIGLRDSFDRYFRNSLTPTGSLSQ